MKNAQSAIHDLLEQFDGTPEAAASAARTFEGIAGYDATADVRVMVLLHDLASDKSMRHAVELLKGLSDGAKLMRGLAAALAEKDVERRVSWGNKLAAAALRFREQHFRRRADAVEALAGSDTPETREILWGLARSEGNRVAANALLSLYWMSDTRVFCEFRQMALHADRRYRASALWAMGKTGDPRFSELLLKMLEDPEPALRRAAFASMRAIKEGLARAAHAPALPVKILRVTEREGERRAWVVAWQPDGKNLPELPARSFIVRENGAPVESYDVERIRPEGPINIGVLAVATRGGRDADYSMAEQAVARMLDHKRPVDRCSLLKLRSGGVGSPVAALEVTLITQTWILRRIGTQPISVSDAPGTAAIEGMRRLIGALGEAPGQRHILCCFPDPGDLPTDAGALVKEAVAAGITVHAIVTGEGPAPPECAQLAEGTCGALLIARTPAAVRDSWRMLYQGIVGGYYVRWHGPGAPGPVSLRLATGEAAGHAAWPEPAAA